MTDATGTGSIVTFINVFTVDPEQQQRLVDLLTQATEGRVSKATGFLGSTLYRSTDGTKVTMHARWRSIEDYQVMRANASGQSSLQEALTFAKFEPGMYEIVRDFQPDDAP
jgi:heme-degrading monooxygenase HmoA